jgi:hypothetical protein
MKKLLLVFVLTFCTSCAALNAFIGIDEKGNKTDETPPVKYLTEVLKAFGPLGVLGGGLVTAGAAAYSGHKRGEEKFEAVVDGVQKAKKEMTDEEREQLVLKLKEHIPNKYHGAIRKVKDRL